MWKFLVRFIFRNRPYILVATLLLTVFMGWKGLNVGMSYDFVKMLPGSDSTVIAYENFKAKYGEDGSVIVIGVQTPEMFTLKNFNEWYDLTNDISGIEGVKGVMSVAKTVDIFKNDSTKKFEFVQLVNSRPTTQAEVDSLKAKSVSLKFYDGLLWNSESNSYLLAITLKQDVLNNKKRIKVTENIIARAEKYTEATGNKLHYSGMPFIRTEMMQMIQQELFLFIILSILIAAVILYLFFRSFRVVLSSLVVVTISIVFTLGYIGLMGYKISILTGVIPSLIVVIAIENVIYILNKYHWEYRNHGNKIRALSRVIQRIGFASLMVNTATAVGFATFILVSNQLLREFGLIASISILTEYLLCITLIPIIFSYLDPPKEKHVKHLDNNFFNAMLEKIIYIIQNHRKWIFSGMVLLLIVGIIGMFNMQTSGKVVDDISENSTIYKDLKFFENEFGGVMPFEISIETQKKKGVIQAATIHKINQFQDSVLTLGGFSKPLSLAEFLKFSKQAYYNGNPGSFSLPNNMERNFILAYLPQDTSGSSNLLNSFIDKDQQRTRISFQMADSGTKEVKSLVEKTTAFADSIFPKDQYNVVITGNSVVYAKGTEFLIKHLVISVVLAIIFISVLMALMFSSIRMIAVSMIPNIIPLIITAAIMGFTGVPIKPSTIIVFSIALGISVDNTIQYLSRYRHELKITNGNIKLSTLNALREAGFSMMYTSVVLVLGFSVFMISDFGGTQALGMLVSATLFIAMFFNMLVLPSLLLVLDKYIVTKAFEGEQIIEIYDEADVDGEVRKEKLNGD